MSLVPAGVLGDVIDHLVGIDPGSPLDIARAQRSHARENAQRSYLSLFAPADVTAMSLPERVAVAVFVTGLHRQPAIASFYAADLDPALKPAVDEAVNAGLTRGPYGHYPHGPLSVEDQPGVTFDAGDLGLDRRLTAAFTYAHRLVFHPRDAEPRALQALLDAGWSTTGIVTLSQLVAFLAFQVRVVVGLRALAAA
jgi:CMD domain protein